MTFRDALRKRIAKIRKIPDQPFGLRPYAVEVIVTTWPGVEVGDDTAGAPSTTVTPITNAGSPPKCRWLTDEELAIGDYQAATVEIGPITPDYPGGGIPISDLRPDPPVTSTVQVRITGPRHPTGALYRIKKITDERGYHFRMLCEHSSPNGA